MSLQHSPSIILNGLVLCLDAANKKSYSGSGNTWIDLSGNGRNAILANSPTYSSANSGFLTFDGATQTANVSNWNILTGNPSFSYCHWFIKYNNNGSDWLSYGSNGTYSENQFGIYNSTLGALQNGFQVAVPVSAITSGIWYHGSVTHDGTTTKLYINGGLVASGTATYTFSSSSLSIGGAIQGGYFGNVSLSQILYYNRTLSAAEIQQNFNALRGRYGI